MTDKPKRPRDANQLAKFIVDVATGVEGAGAQIDHEAQKKGGRRGGRARAEALSPTRRAEIASKAAKVRWEKDGE